MRFNGRLTLTTFMLIIVFSFMGCAKSKMIKTTLNDKVTFKEQKLKTYIDEKYGFSVDYPQVWDYKTVKDSNVPDGGIIIFLAGNQEEKIYVFGQNGHINLPVQGFTQSSFSTKSGLGGTLYSKENNEKQEIYLILEDGFHGVYIDVGTDCYNNNKEQIIDILKSIKVE